MRLLDEIYHTMRGQAGDVLFFFVDDRQSTPEVVAGNSGCARRGLSAGICARKERKNVIRPRDYRAVPSRFFHNAVQVVYADCVAQHFGGESTRS